MTDHSGRRDGGHGREVEVEADLDAVARAGADLFVERSRAATATGWFKVALSGGSTPRALHALLSSLPYRDMVDWSRIQFFWGDERYVPPDDPESNYRMARETLLDRLPVGESQIHRIPTESADPHQSAASYAEELQAVFGLATGQLPRFDLIFLGMGPDGHTASLFPHTEALAVDDLLVVANFVPKLAAYRITLTVPVINHAAVVAFLVAGPDKAPALARVMQGPADPEEFPSQLVAPANGSLYWLVDRQAATLLAGTGSTSTTDE